jgi:hypothetical protein
MMVQGKQRGRPPLEPGKAKRAAFNTRLRPSLKLALEAAAKQEGRSLSEEIEFRLERSLEDQRQIGTAISLGMYIGISVLDWFKKLTADVKKHGDPARHTRAIVAIKDILEGVITVRGEPAPPGQDLLQEAVDRFPQLGIPLMNLEEALATLNLKAATGKTRKPPS